MASRISIVSTLAVVVIQLVASAAEPMTNQDVVKMVKGGVPLSVIEERIGAGPVHFDVGTDALIDLSRNGVPDQLQRVMIRRMRQAVDGDAALKGGRAASEVPTAEDGISRPSGADAVIDKPVDIDFWVYLAVPSEEAKTVTACKGALQLSEGSLNWSREPRSECNVSFLGDASGQAVGVAWRKVDRVCYVLSDPNPAEPLTMGGEMIVETVEGSFSLATVKKEDMQVLQERIRVLRPSVVEKCGDSRVGTIVRKLDAFPILFPASLDRGFGKTPVWGMLQMTEQGVEFVPEKEKQAGETIAQEWSLIGGVCYKKFSLMGYAGEPMVKVYLKAGSELKFKLLMDFSNREPFYARYENAMVVLKTLKPSLRYGCR